MTSTVSGMVFKTTISNACALCQHLIGDNVLQIVDVVAKACVGHHVLQENTAHVDVN